MNIYKAMTRQGLPIITVFANDKKEAHKLLREQLTTNRSRLPYLKKWEKDGCIIKKQR